MAGFKTNNGSIKAFALLFSFVLVLVGCSESPVATGPDNGPIVLSRSAASGVFANSTGGSMYAEEMISAEEGGRLTLFDVTLEIPAGAIDSDTLFSITIPDINVFYNEFGTHGLVFNEPVKVVMSYRGADLSGVDETTIRIGWYNPYNGDFQDVDCTVDTSTKTVTGYLDHFSAYALISDEK